MKIMTAAVIASVMLLVLKSLSRDCALPVSAAVCVVVSAVALVSLSPLLEYFASLSENTDHGQYIKLVLKASGVAAVSSVCAGVCRDLGEASLANAVIMAGKCELLLISLPLFKSVVSLAKELVA